MVKVSAKVGNFRLPADMLREETFALDATLGIVSMLGFTNLGTKHAPNLSSTSLLWAEGVETSCNLLRRDIYSRMDLLCYHGRSVE
jgi:hypothetical protein